MKKILLFLFLALFINTTYSQTIAPFSAKEGYEYLKSQAIFDKFTFVYAMGMQVYTIPESNLDFNTGLSNIWAYLCKSKDTTDQNGHMFIVIKMNNNLNVSYQSDNQTNYQMLPEIPDENWLNSTEISQSIVQSTEFINYLEKNKDRIIFKQLNLQYLQDPNNSTQFLTQWMASALINEEDMAYCLYDAKTGKNLGCDITSQTNVEINRLIQNVFPNPAYGKITLNTQITDKADIIVYDTDGRSVKQFANVVPNNLVLDLSELKAGNYTIAIMFSNKILTKKVILIK